MMLKQNRSLKKISFEDCGLGDEFGIQLPRALKDNRKITTQVNLEGKDSSK